MMAKRETESLRTYIRNVINELDENQLKVIISFLKEYTKK